MPRFAMALPPRRRASLAGCSKGSNTNGQKFSILRRVNLQTDVSFGDVSVLVTKSRTVFAGALGRKAVTPSSEARPSSWRRSWWPLLLLFALLFALPAEAQTSTSSDGWSEFQHHRAALQSVLAPLPGIAISPSLTAAALAGAALVCETQVHERLSMLCDVPLVARLNKSSSRGLFFLLSAFALVCYLANTGKFQGVLGKALKVLEIGPTLAAYFLVSRDVLDPVAPVGSQAATILAAGAGPVLVALGLCLGLVALLLVRLTAEVIVWLSPFPFVDAIFETGSRVVALGFLLLAFLSPAAAAVIALLSMCLAMLLVRSSLRTLAFVFRMVVRPLYARLAETPLPPLVEPAWTNAHAGEPCALAIPAAALEVPGIRPRTGGRLVAGPDGVFFASQGRWARERRARLNGTDRHVRLLQRPFWTEVQATERGVPIARLALAHDLQPLHRAIAARLNAQTMCEDA